MERTAFATDYVGRLQILDDCYIRVPGVSIETAHYGKSDRIYMNNLPEISDQKSATYTEENAMGRSVPVKAFSNGSTRKIGWKFTMWSQEEKDRLAYIKTVRTLEACVYPKEDKSNILPYIPPPILSIKCGKLLADYELTVILTDYSLDFPTDQPWSIYGNSLYWPTKVTMNLNFEVVYDSRYLPGASRILQIGV